MIPLLKEGFEPPRGFSYKRLPKTFCLFVRVGSRMMRLELSTTCPWVGLTTFNLAAPK